MFFKVFTIYFVVFPSVFEKKLSCVFCDFYWQDYNLLLSVQPKSKLLFLRNDTVLFIAYPGSISGTTDCCFADFIP